ncbi:MAG: 16S rRNA (cytosine(1402)-N(4))-methyltransferase RsmH [Oscillospiraceae bacterium]|nr:16S rRNA (cytosine(1402)-N(4))-methyltransferase RsmH [Oscillospiraceae bacterium]MCL2278088.1 16S rRNA (cytosine(1402)-N(4))-methyltransferase RsmH [Oscillospiraceae bacterium]
MKHLPVLLSESIDYLNIKPDGIYVDGTLGRGGHTVEIASRLNSGKLIAIDADEQAIKEAREITEGFEDRITFIHDNFRDLKNILNGLGIDSVHGMIFDLGVSSPQLDDMSRGFSYMQDSKLDMRMDRRNTLTAHDIVNGMSEENLRKLFFEYGEERYSRQIARKIVVEREKSTVETTGQLSNIIFSAIPAQARRENQHPSKRIFQAIRIAVNDELDSIKQALQDAPGLLKPKGRLCVISFHSLEDRIVKNSFREHSEGCRCSKKLPVCVCGRKPELKIITKKPIVASSGEIETNPRSRSAKLRVAERLA